MRFSVSLAVLYLATVSAAPAQAEVTQSDLQVIARVLSFMERPLTGVVNVGIVYEPTIQASRRDAQAVSVVMGSAFRVGRLELRPVIITIDEAAGANVDLILLTGSVGAEASSLVEISAQRRIPCFTLDLDRVRDGTCAIGLSTRPRVDIVVHRAAASNSGVVFATAFRVMTTEL